MDALKSSLKWTMFILFILLQNTSSAAKTVFVTIDALTLFADPAHTQSINLLGTLGNTYIASHLWHHDESVMLGIGLRTYQRHQMAMRTSLQFIPYAKVQSQGDILQLHSPSFRNLSYAYDITSRFLLVDHAITWTKYSLQPGVLIGAGGVSNATSNYYEIPLSNHAAPSSEYFADHAQLQLAYEVGAVLDLVFKDVSIRAAYRYLRAGTGRLGLSPLQNTSDYLTTGPIDYHALSIGVRFEQTI